MYTHFYPQLIQHTTSRSLKTPDFFKARYGVDNVFYTDEMSDILAKLRPSALLTMHGVNSDSKSSFSPPMFEGMDQFKVDDTFLYNEMAEWLVNLIGYQVLMDVSRVIMYIS